MEGAQGPNIAQIASMQGHAAQQGDEEKNLNFFNNLFPVKALGIDFLESLVGNLSGAASGLLNQALMMGGFASFLGKEPWKSVIGINLFGKQTHFNINSGAEEILGHAEAAGDYQPPEPMHDPGMEMMSAGVGDMQEAPHIEPPRDTPMMDHQPILDRSEGRSAGG